MDKTQYSPEFLEWAKKNPWLGVDKERTDIYLGISIGLRYLKVPIVAGKFMAAVDAAYREYKQSLLAEGNKPNQQSEK